MASYKQIMGTNGNDSTILTTSAGQQEVVLALAGDDMITADFGSADYIIGGEGKDLLTTNFSYSSFLLKAHPLIDEAYLVTYKGSDGKVVINIIKGVEEFQFAEGKNSLNDFLAGTPIDQSGVNTVILDGHGEIDNYETLDASSANFLYKDDLALSDFVEIKNFANGDQIDIIGSVDQVSIVNDGADVFITNNSTTGTGDVVISSIILLGVVSADDIVFDEATFEQAMGFNALNITIA